MLKYAFKATDGMTPSLPSGLNYTLGKALARHEKMWEYHAAMMSLPFQYAFAHPR